MFFFWSLTAVAFQLSIMASFVLVAVVTFTKLGNMRICGKDAKPKYSFWTWFAMTLTGGIATGIVTWGVNEPLIYYGNVGRAKSAWDYPKYAWSGYFRHGQKLL